jgi:hypothetical protein
MIGLGVIKQCPIPLAYLLYLPQGVRFVAGVAPHFLPLNEKRIPVIYAGVDREEPASWFRRVLYHQKYATANYTRVVTKVVKIVRGRGGKCGRGRGGGRELSYFDENVLATNFDGIAIHANCRV